MARVLVSNPYVFNKRGKALAEWLDDRRFDVALLNEMRLLHDDVRHLGHLASGKHGEMRNNVVLTREPHHGKRVVKLCEGVEGSKVWKDRLYVRVVQDGVAYYVTHANAVIQNEAGGFRANRGASRWRRAMTRMLPAIRADIEAGLDVVVGGDFNWRHRRTDGRVHFGSPEWLFREAGLKFVTTEVMWLAYSPGLTLNGWRKFRTPPGADGHPVLLADLTRTPEVPEIPETPEKTEEVDVPTGYMPGVIHKPIPAGSNDPVIDPVGVIYHVAVSLADSLHDFFAHRSGGIESHFYVRLDGTIEQYRSIFREADANYRANSFGSPRKGFISIETEGMGAGEWTEAQIEALKRITVWCAEQGNFPIRKAPGPYSPGVGYHTMFGAPSDWTPVSKSCPGPARIRQFNTIFVPWFRDGAQTDEKDWFDMATEKDLRRIVREEMDAVLNADINFNEPKGEARFRGMSLRVLLKEIHRAVVKRT